jgi:hypothetical protein
VTAKARLRSADMARMAKIAKEFGVVVEHVVGGVTTRVSPHDPDSASAVNKPDALIYNRSTRPLIPLLSDMHRREFDALERLAEVGVGVWVYSCTLRQFGPHTQAKLLASGYVEVLNEKGSSFKDDQISLTDEGLRKWKAEGGGASF